MWKCIATVIKYKLYVPLSSEILKHTEAYTEILKLGLELSECYRSLAISYSKAAFLTLFSRQLLSFTPFFTDEGKGLEVS